MLTSGCSCLTNGKCCDCKVPMKGKKTFVAIFKRDCNELRQIHNKCKRCGHLPHHE